MRRPQLDAPESIAAGEAAEITVKTDAPGATICLSQRDGLYEVAEADESGNATFKVTAMGNPISVTVSGPSLNVAEGEIEVR